MSALERGRRLRRGALLVLVGLALAAAAAAEVRGRLRASEELVGRPVTVVAAARDLHEGALLRSRDLALRRIPVRFAPPSAYADPRFVIGRRLRAPLMRGDPVTVAALADGAASDERARTLGTGERLVEVQVAGGAALAGAEPGTRVDVVVSEATAGGGRSALLLEALELRSLRPLGSPGAGAPGGSPAEASAAEGGESARLASHLAVLRVTPAQAVKLTAAAVFAREVRLLLRPPGDRRRAGTIVAAGGAQ